MRETKVLKLSLLFFTFDQYFQVPVERKCGEWKMQYPYSVPFIKRYFPKSNTKYLIMTLRVMMLQIRMTLNKLLHSSGYVCVHSLASSQKYGNYLKCFNFFSGFESSLNMAPHSGKRQHSIKEYSRHIVFLVTSSRPEVFCKTDVLKNFAKLTGKHLCQRLFK